MYKLSFTEKVEKQLSKLDKQIEKKILKYLKTHVLENPTQHGKPLSANLLGLWRYRVGDYRIITEIRDKELVVLVVEVGHRKEVYK
jgi:mRNA interferase RelE/StbE